MNLHDVYAVWTESDDYKNQSYVESKKYDEDIKEIIGEKKFSEIDDEICNVGYTAEICGFRFGFSYGIQLMSDILGKECNRI